ncbi:MAG TPA: hypothetical protein VEJ45_12535 [Candidatus Acidoferrales bacterium]|nr:hypothetical protein [Candidatus Acidoferrales bacterium]
MHANVRARLHTAGVKRLFEASVIQYQMVRERVLAELSGFFAHVALGASAGHVVRSVATNLFVMIFLGAIIGLAGGLTCGRLVDTLLFEVKPTDQG